MEPEGWLVTRFIAGETPPLTRMREPEMLGRVAQALRAFHESPAIPGSFDSFRVVEIYRETALARGGTIPEAYDWAHEIARRIEFERGDAEPRPCHNDLLNANFLDDGEHLRIVDWEYAGMGDVFFDLANFSINHELDSTASAVLLEEYFGDVRPADVRALELMRFMSDFREAMWGVVQTAVSELDFDFVGYASEHFERLRRTAAEPSVPRGARLRMRRGAPCGAPRQSNRRAGYEASVGKRELAGLLLLQPLELLLGAHAHRAREPLFGRQRPTSRRRSGRCPRTRESRSSSAPRRSRPPRAARPCTAGR